MKRIDTTIPTFARICFWAVYSIAFVSSLWLIFLTISRGVGLTSSSVMLLAFLTLLAIVALVYLRNVHHPRWLQSPVLLTIVFVSSLLIGVILRLIFLRFSSEYLPVGETTDTGVHWYGAQEILATGRLQSPSLGIYEAYFPYLTTFSAFMACMMRIFGVNYLAVLLPNLIADLITTFIIYYLLRRWQNRHAALIGASIWIINPIGISFCVQGLALSVTNLFIALSILLVYTFWRLLKSHDYHKFLTIAALTGLTMALGNSIRSVFSILLIALFLFLSIQVLTRPTRQLIFQATSGFLMVIMTFIAGTSTLTCLQKSLNPYYTENHGTLGWSIFVGANFSSQGRWSYADWDDFSPQLFDPTTSQAELNSQFTQRAISRYREMSPSNLVVHLINKSAMLFTRNSVTPIRNLEEQFTSIDGTQRWYQLLNDVFYLTLAVFLVATALFFWRALRHHSLDYYTFFLALCFCGLLASSLMVEVMSRYISIFLVFFVIFSAYVIAGNSATNPNSDFRPNS